MEFQELSHEHRPSTLVTKQGSLIQFPDGAIGMVTQSYRVGRGTNDYVVAILNGERAGSIRFCMHTYDHERKNVQVTEPVKYQRII